MPQDSTESPKGKTLHSWKEIAHVLRVTVRTAQRWERNGGLPIYRQGGAGRGHVFAYERELLEWRDAGGEAGADARHNAATATDQAPGFRSWRRPAVFVAVGAVLAAAVLLSGAFSSRRQPHSWRIQNHTLQVFDARGRLCWEKPIPPLPRDYDLLVRDRVLIADIDGNGRIETLFNRVPEDFASSTGAVLCYESDGRLRWEHPYGASRTFGSRSFSAQYRGSLLIPVKDGGRPRLVAVSNHYLWYPSRAELLDPADGRTLEEYWHPGALSRGMAQDMDGDGNDEVLLAGVNNPGDGLGHPCLAALTVPFSRAPRRGDGAFPAATGGGEAQYLLFPTPDVDAALGQIAFPMRLGIEGNRIMVETSLPEHGGIVYYLDFRFNVLEHRFSDNFRAVHAKLRAAGQLDHDLSQPEIERLGKAVRFPAAPDGNAPGVQEFWK